MDNHLTTSNLLTTSGLFRIGSFGPFVGAFSPRAPRLSPYFTRRVAGEIARAYEALPPLEGETKRRAEYDAIADAFRFSDPVTDEWLVWRGTRVRGGARGGKRYPIGTPEWTWELVGPRGRRADGDRAPSSAPPEVSTS